MPDVINKLFKILGVDNVLDMLNHNIYCLVENLYIKADERINFLKGLSISMAEVASEKKV